MPTAFWIKRFLLVLCCTFVLLCAVQLLKGHGLADAVVFAALWAAIASGVFTVARFFQARRGQHCALCQDTPEMRAPGADR